jgi:hypothetical protein
MIAGDWPYIVADWHKDSKDKQLLGEYFNLKNMPYDFIPSDESLPLVDQLAYSIGGKKDIFMIFNFHKTLRRLYEEKSHHHDFRDLCRDHNLIVFQNDLTCNLTVELLAQPDFADWINSMAPTVFLNGFPGISLKKGYDKCDFIELWHECVDPLLTTPHLAGMKDHKPDRDFLCLMCDKEERPHRRLLHQKITSAGLTDNAIYNFAKRSAQTHSDLDDQYQTRVIEGFSWRDGLPPLQYYNRTNFELVVETQTQINHDDTFELTEKTTKPISMKHPFMILSNYNFLKNLQKMGFKTFHEHIDESYDEKTDVNERIDIIVRNLGILSEDSQRFYSDTHQIREHNHRHLQDLGGRFKTTLWRKLDEFWKNI